MSARMADDLFAGAGGWDLAAAGLGVHARGIENMKEARATRDAAGLATIHDDVWTYRPDGDAEGLIASPPCQTFSAAGNRITIHEAGILQTFPSDYPWSGVQSKQYLQAGNAVPPGLALHALAAASGIDAREVAA